MIHFTAVIHPKARLDPSVSVGPYAVIDEAVELGEDCVVGPHVYLTGLMKAGKGNRFFAGAVLGEAPQDLKYRNEPTGLRIGDNNVFREHVTVHRSAKPGEDTVIGSGNYFMQHSHVAHNVHVGDHTIIAGGALLAGHVVVQDRAFVSGNCLVHQFTRVGALALMQGGAAISKDLPPYTIAQGINSIRGLNVVGLRRAGIGPGERLELKRLYRLLFRDGKSVRAAAAAAAGEFKSGPEAAMIGFIAESARGVCVEGAEHEREEG
ncbi:MAG TPA: acyl-ACP--UDP-N-acetylglucosamine O-acyltransferase [Verrucomicrobiae bacterium]|nr:acyl-ACP--UDP-N-acetylglucosamine O-acyltransferase [Verrucomicrobiae bacterium]